MQLALIQVILLVTGFQCSNERDDTAVNKCDCKTTPIVEEKKDVEAVVVRLISYQDQVRYVLSTEPRDFVGNSHTVGSNILVPCDSLQSQYRQAGKMLVVSYGRKDCCGILTSPNFRSNYGCYVELISIRVKS